MTDTELLKLLLNKRVSIDMLAVCKDLDIYNMFADIELTQEEFDEIKRRMNLL